MKKIKEIKTTVGGPCIYKRAIFEDGSVSGRIQYIGQSDEQLEKELIESANNLSPIRMRTPMPTKQRKRKGIRAWMSFSDYERSRGYAYIHIQNNRPITDTNYKVVEVLITELPKRRKS